MRENAVLRKLDGYHEQRDVLRSISLRGRDTNFRTSIDVDTTMRLTRDRRTDRVHDTDAKGTALKAVAQGQDRVGGLTTL